MWVLQETVVATRSAIVCGQLTIDWDVVEKVARSMKRCGVIGNLEVEGTAPGCTSVNLMADLKDSLAQGKGSELLYLLILTRAYQASDARGKIFALMGCASNAADFGVNVDYDVDTRHLFKQFAIHSLTVHESLLCLFSAWCIAALGQSWVPDWSNYNEYRACLAEHGSTVFNAAGSTIASPIVSEDHQTLTLRGYVVDRITHAAPAIRKIAPLKKNCGPLTGYNPTDLAARLAMEKREWDAASAVPNEAFLFHDGPEREEALMRTFCCDLWTTRKQASIKSGQGASIQSGQGAYFSLSCVLKGVDAERGTIDPQKLDPRMAEFAQGSAPYLHAADFFGVGRSVCATEKGRMGCVPHGAEIGDPVVVFEGGWVPFLLRRVEGFKGRRIFVGECYIHGIMYGEAMKSQAIIVEDLKIG